jgi:hypothetical protein
MPNSTNFFLPLDGAGKSCLANMMSLATLGWGESTILANFYPHPRTAKIRYAHQEVLSRPARGQEV